MQNSDNIENLVIPEHVAIILDGNGRWAKKRGLPRSMGHKEGCKTLEDIVEQAARLGIRYLTVYGFSTENWKRPSEEVGALMQLFRYYMVRFIKIANENNVRAKMIGERSRFDQDIIEGINRMERETKDNTGLTFVFAVNYGGRDEIVRGVRKLLTDCQDGGIKPEDITEEVFSSYLDTAGMPDPDLLIRTSGELRLSNYLLWQCAYTEIYVTDCLWPDFNREELEKAIAAYNKRERFVVELAEELRRCRGVGLRRGARVDVERHAEPFERRFNQLAAPPSGPRGPMRESAPVSLSLALCSRNSMSR